jgi:catechol 2,3-dioxygenase-like lactoylglutathione lyase family enzyme
MLKAFFHTGFVVRDLDRTIDFYTGVLGLQVAGRMERAGDFACQLLAFDNAHIKGAFLDLGDGHQLELIQYLTPPSGPGGINRNDLGASHLAFFVQDIEQFHA